MALVRFPRPPSLTSLDAKEADTGLGKGFAREVEVGS